MRNKRNNLLLVLILILVLAIIGLVYVLVKGGKIAPQAAGQGAVLSLSPSSGSYNVGETFNVNLIIDTDGVAVVSVSIRNLHYDPQILELQSVNASSNFQTIPEYHPSLGELYYVTDCDTDFNGQGIVSTFVFKSIQVGTSQITMDFAPGGEPQDTSWVSQAGIMGNYLGSVNNGSATIKNPTQEISPTPPTGGGKKTPTSSPTQTVTPEPTSEPSNEPTPEPLPPLPSSVARTTATPTPQIPSPTPEPARISNLDLPIAPEPNISSEPIIQIGGFSITPKYIWIVYVGGPILITGGIYLLWFLRKKHKKALEPKLEKSENRNDLKI